MQNSHTPVYNGERTPHDHIGAAFGGANFAEYPAFAPRSRGGLIGRSVMIWFAIVYFSGLCNLLECAYRAPVLDLARLEDLMPEVANPKD